MALSGIAKTSIGLSIQNPGAADEVITALDSAIKGGGGKPDCVTFTDGATRDFLHIGPAGCTRLAAFVAAGRALA